MCKKERFIACSLYQVLVAFSGFLINNTPVFFRWIPKISFVTFAYSALYQNELDGLEMHFAMPTSNNSAAAGKCLLEHSKKHRSEHCCVQSLMLLRTKGSSHACSVIATLDTAFTQRKSSIFIDNIAEDSVPWIISLSLSSGDTHGGTEICN